MAVHPTYPQHINNYTNTDYDKKGKNGYMLSVG